MNNRPGSAIRQRLARRAMSQRKQVMFLQQRLDAIAELPETIERDTATSLWANVGVKAVEIAKGQA